MENKDSNFHDFLTEAGNDLCMFLNVRHLYYDAISITKYDKKMWWSIGMAGIA